MSRVLCGFQPLFPGSSAGKVSTCNAGDTGSIPGLGISPGGGNSYPLQYSGLENSMDCINKSACGAGDPGLIPGSGRSPGVGNGNLLQYYCLENSMDRGPLVGYSSLGCKELDMTEDTHTYTHTHYTV